MTDIATQNQTRPNANRGRRTNRSRGKGGASAPAKPISTGEAQTKPNGVVQEAAAVAQPVADAEEVDESRICWICAEPVKYYSVSECNHRTCHVCALRLRALYKKLDCTFCKEPQPTVIFTVSADAPFSSYAPADISFKDAKLSIFFETQEMMEDTLILLRFNCPDQSCDYIATGWNDLKLHARGVHGKLMCDICLRQKKVFSHEHALYSAGQLAVHLPSIPHRGQKPVSKEPIEGGVHPLCEFCRECFFGDDELYAHMRHTHEECFICKRNDVRDQYFKNYEALEKHFEHAHHPCPNATCQARKFVVFGSLLDLQAHNVEEHGADMSSRDKKDARRINAGFEFQEARRRAPRERDREPPPGPPPGAAGLPRANNSNRRNRFGAHLTVDGGNESSGNDSAGPSRRQTPSPPPQDMDPVTAERHAALYARLRAVAPNPTNAVAAVKLSLRSYNSAESGARDLISTIWNILDRDLDNTASVVNLIIDLLEDEDKKSSLLAAWNGFKIEQRRQFPDLVPTSIGSDYAGITGGRVLNARTSGALHTSRQSSRAVWDRVAQAATNGAGSAPPPRAQRFPPLQPSNPPVNTGFRQAQRTTAWSASAAGVTPSPPPPIPTSTSTGNTRQPPPPTLSSKAFPTLPTSSVQKLKPVTGGNSSLHKILGSTAPTTSAWTPGGGSSAQPNTGEGADAASTQDGAATVGKKKGKGKQKQTLFTLGSFPT
ncbi:hypothetical protein BV25DRAFT_430668 [Artomyces pyxidatus]|uniref:Uncharacterized protein n=1 Tax=Artomyces pyxidatus TaxID=48021 RepID=A0ACB8T400_9AGAM|nr:hypothetical protein BV25DRAFT_430668 [Artomyces pyxidatus]